MSFFAIELTNLPKNKIHQNETSQASKNQNSGNKEAETSGWRMFSAKVVVPIS